MLSICAARSQNKSACPDVCRPDPFTTPLVTRHPAPVSRLSLTVRRRPGDFGGAVMRASEHRFVHKLIRHAPVGETSALIQISGSFGRITPETSP